MLWLAKALDIRGPLGAFNGGVILRADGTIVSGHRLDPAVAAAALGHLEEAGVEIWLFAGGLWYARTDQGVRIPHERLAADIEPTVVTDFAGIGQVDKIVGISEDPAALERLEAVVRTAIGTAATIARSQAYFLDITAPQANKGDGVAAIAQAAGVPLSQVAVIGDMANDLPMFARAGLSIAMGQAPQAVRTAATFVTTSNDEDGVAAAIDRFVLRAAAPA
jgi:Cof subfamily protein (haloacid dehalogenase superfamily)